MEGKRSTPAPAPSRMKDEEFHPRAMKLIRKRKNFIVVAEDEPYFMEVYGRIRKEEKIKGKWSDLDEKIYQSEKRKHLCNANKCNKMAVLAGLCKDHSF